MIRDINGLGSPPSNDKRTGSSGQTAAEKAPQTSSSAPTATSTSDAVELSSKVSTLQAAEVSIRSLPDVDNQRVAQVKAALANNEYKIDNLKLADKILANDALLDR